MLWQTKVQHSKVNSRLRKHRFSTWLESMNNWKFRQARRWMQRVNMQEPSSHRSKVSSQDLRSTLKYYRWNQVDSRSKMRPKTMNFNNLKIILRLRKHRFSTWLESMNNWKFRQARRWMQRVNMQEKRASMQEQLPHRSKVSSQDLRSTLKYYRWNQVDSRSKMRPKIVKFYN